MAGKRGYAKFRWDGEADTANRLIGEDYTVDWEYQSPESSDIRIGGKYTAQAAVGDWIVRWAGGGFTVYAPDGKTVRSSTDYPVPEQPAEPPVEMKTAVPAEPCYRVIQVNAPCDRAGDSSARERLAREVSDAMAKGWKPTGGVAVQMANGHAVFCQAMWRPAGWKAWAEPVGNFPPAGQSPVPKHGSEFRPEEDGAIHPQPAGEAEVPEVDEPRKAVDPAEERRLIAWLSGLAKGQPGWVADWVYKTTVGMKPHATIHLKTNDVMSPGYAGYWLSLIGTAEILFPWADLSVKPQRSVKPS